MISGIINSTPFSVYNLNGEMIVWDKHYIQWSPSDISGSFTMEGSTYSLEDYSGYFEFLGSSITSSAFKSNPDIVTVETDAMDIQRDAFRECPALASVSLSECKVIGSTAFYKCYSLSSVYAPYVESVSWMGFESCSSLTSIDLPNCSYIDAAAFGYCLSLSRISAPKVEYISRVAFFSCPLLASVYLPSCSVIESGAFQRCYALSNVSIPVCESIGSSAFRSCSSLDSITLPVCSFIGEQAFYGCREFDVIVLESSSVCVLANSNAMQGTYITPSTGYIVVPSSLLSDYQVASEWSYFFPRIITSESLSYYIKWTPKNLSGTFRVNSVSYRYEDYNGFFVIDNGGVISSVNMNPLAYNPVYPSMETVEISAASDIVSTTFAKISTLSEASFYPVYSSYDQVAFARCGFREFSSSSCTYVGVGAFQHCSLLSKVDLPNCSYVAGDGFCSCPLLTDVSLPNCGTVQHYAFERCSSLSYINLPLCSSIYESAFYDCTGLIQADLPACKIVGMSVFTNCTSLESVNLPSCEMILAYAFSNCSRLTNISIPNCKTINRQAFEGCTKLSSIRLTGCTLLDGAVFSGCTSLTTVILDGSEVCSKVGNPFVDTPIYDSGGKLYVPASLYASYRNDGWWIYNLVSF